MLFIGVDMLIHTDMEKELDIVTTKCIELIAKCFAAQGGNGNNAVKKELRKMWFKAEENERRLIVDRIKVLQEKLESGR
jgi:hypothetical protein